MRNARNIIISSLICALFLLDGGFAYVGSILFLISGIFSIITSAMVKFNKEIRHLLKTRSWVVYVVCELISMYPIWYVITHEWYTTSVLYLVGVIFETDAMRIAKQDGTLKS